MKRPRLRKWAKWACTLAAAMAVGVAVFSGFYYFCWASTVNHGDRLRLVGVDHGSLRWYSEYTPNVGSMPWLARPYSGCATADDPGPIRHMWRARCDRGWRAGLQCEQIGPFSAMGMSVLYPVFLTTIPAALLWYVDHRRFGPGRCAKCGYDRRGHAAAVKCPECGTPTSPAP